MKQGTLTHIDQNDVIKKNREEIRDVGTSGLSRKISKAIETSKQVE